MQFVMIVDTLLPAGWTWWLRRGVAQTLFLPLLLAYFSVILWKPLFFRTFLHQPRVSETGSGNEYRCENINGLRVRSTS
jgi:hypothetical protein